MCYTNSIFRLTRLNRLHSTQTFHKFEIRILYEHTSTPSNLVAVDRWDRQRIGFKKNHRYYLLMDNILETEDKKI